MSRLCIKAVFVTCVAVSLSFAQNARIEAMGGVSVIDDIGAVINAPADMNDFKDVVQATGFEDTAGVFFGPYIGIKQLSDIVSLGIMGNTGMVLDEFYGSAINFVNDGLTSGAGAAPALGGMPQIPHVLLGLDFDAVTLGLDFFIEYQRSSFSQDIDGDETTESGRVSNIGGIANANISLGGDMFLSPVFGFSRPSINQITELPDTTTDERISEKGIFLTAGTEFGIRLFDASWFVGLFWSMERFQFSDEIANTESEINKNNSLDAYLGFSTTVLNNLLFVGEYALGLDFYTNEEPDDDSSSTQSSATHRFAAGLEKPVEGFWIFDQLIGRAGVNLIIDANGSSSSNEDTETTTNVNDPNQFSQVSPTLGLGLTKGLFQFDILTNIAGWAGVIAGPPVVAGTVTLNFGGSSPDPVFEPTPSYTPSPSSTPEYQQPEEDTEEEQGGGSDFSF